MQAAEKPGIARKDPAERRAMNGPMRVAMAVLCAVFVLYLVLLLKLLLFSRPPGSEHSLNLIPFASIANYLFSDSAGVKRFAFANIVGNIVAFIPLGAFLPFMRCGTTTWKNLLLVVCVSVAVEILQGAFGLGASDIDDVILNTLGGLVGILFLTLLRRLMTRDRVIIVMAALSILAAPILGAALFAVRLRM